MDPLTSSYPWYTPYQFAGNKPIVAIDLDGLEEEVRIIQAVDGKSAVVQTITDKKVIQGFYNNALQDLKNGNASEFYGKEKYLKSGKAPETGYLEIAVQLDNKVTYYYDPTRLNPERTLGDFLNDADRGFYEMKGDKSGLVKKGGLKLEATLSVKGIGASANVNIEGEKEDEIKTSSGTDLSLDPDEDKGLELDLHVGINVQIRENFPRVRNSVSNVDVSVGPFVLKGNEDGELLIGIDVAKAAKSIASKSPGITSKNIQKGK